MRQRLLSLTLSASILATAALAAAIAPSGMSVFRDPELGFTIAYPAQWSVDAAYRHDAPGPGKPIPGIAFTIPAARGTNLSSDTRLSVEHLPGACAASRFLDLPRGARKIVDGSRTWSVATDDERAAGNRYEESVYALASTSPCIAIRYFIHSTNIGAYNPGTMKEFDRDGLVGIFDRMRHSLTLTK